MNRAFRTLLAETVNFSKSHKPTYWLENNSSKPTFWLPNIVQVKEGTAAVVERQGVYFKTLETGFHHLQNNKDRVVSVMTTAPISLWPPIKKELYIRTKNGKIYYPQASVRIKILDPKCAWYSFRKLSELTQPRRDQTGQNTYTAEQMFVQLFRMILDPKCAWYSFRKLSELTQPRRDQTGQNTYTAEQMFVQLFRMAMPNNPFHYFSTVAQMLNHGHFTMMINERTVGEYSEDEILEANKQFNEDVKPDLKEFARCGFEFIDHSFGLFPACFDLEENFKSKAAI